MDGAEARPTVEERLTKRARHEDLGTSRLKTGSHAAETAVSAFKQPAMHTKALRSVLKGVHSFAFCSDSGTLQLTSLTCLCLRFQFLLSRQVSLYVADEWNTIYCSEAVEFCMSQ